MTHAGISKHIILNLMKNIALFGAPGVGKGTYGKLFKTHFGFPIFSIGDYFRNVIN